VKNLVNWQYLLFTEPWRHSKFVNNLCKIRREKHPRAFVEVVKGSEIYNFPIHHSVHFSSSFGRKTQSKLPKSTHCAGHDAASRRARAPHARRAPAAPASPSGPPAPPEAPRFLTHAHTPRRLGVFPASHAAPAPLHPPVHPVPPCHGRAGQGSWRTHGINVGQALAAKQGPPLPLAAYKADSPPLLACVGLSSGPPWRPARGAHGLKPPRTKLSALSPPWTSTSTSRTVSCPVGGAASPVQRSRRPPMPAAGAPPRRPSPCPNQAQESTP
jgi:hypothetical protein